MKKKELETNLQSLSKSDLRIVLRYVRLRQFRHKIIKFFNRVDLWLFPPVAFFADFFWMKRIFPAHPITEVAILSTAFMAMTLTLFLLRPRKWKRTAHWVRA